MKGLVQLLGPTGIGKSAVAVALARRFAGEIVSVDSLQVYRGFDIGTAKLSPAERGGIPHHLIDLIDDCSQFHAARFLSLSHAACEEILARGHLPLVCGGTLFYQRVMIRGIFPETRGDPEVRHRLLDELRVRGLPALFDELR
ncbi:MAG TPA: isopentenyl transferase family protein, partial [Candidatus Aminicenantes bacterium]|nr:isopentenyl transferase family protein [Candidatus Aminicenantes bacterium]